MRLGGRGAQRALPFHADGIRFPAGEEDCGGSEIGKQRFVTITQVILIGEWRLAVF
jgi:hypothetical protein